MSSAQFTEVCAADAPKQPLPNIIARRKVVETVCKVVETVLDTSDLVFASMSGIRPGAVLGLHRCRADAIQGIEAYNDAYIINIHTGERV